MAKVYYQGHGSFRLETSQGTVVYIDPYAGDGYDLPADLILVSHDHHDHNVVTLPAKKDDCVIYTHKDALKDGAYYSTSVKDVKVTAVPAYNDHHSEKECVGFLIEADEKIVYASGDTSTTEWMKNDAASKKIDYAFFPIDGIYNMGPEEASGCAKMVGAKHNVPIHMIPGGLFKMEFAEKFSVDGRIIVEPGEELILK